VIDEMPSHITFDLGDNYNISGGFFGDEISIRVWNFNNGGGTSRGVKDVEIWVSPDPYEPNLVQVLNSAVDPNFVFPEASGIEGDLGFMVDTAAVTNASVLEDVRLVKFVINSNYGDSYNGLSEVMFFKNIPKCSDWGYHDLDSNYDCVIDLKEVAAASRAWLVNTIAYDPTAVYGDYKDDYSIQNIPLAVSTPTIDGTLDAGEWDDATRVEMVMPGLTAYPNVGSQKYAIPDDAADFSAYYYYKWDADHLYVGIQVYDEALMFTGSGYPGDHVTLAVNPLQAGTVDSDIAFYNMFMDVAGEVASLTTGFNQDLAATNAVYDAATQSDGWSYEVAFKWSDMDGYSPTVGDTHGFAALICDDDDGGVLDTFLYDAGQGNTQIIVNPPLYRVVTLTNAMVCGDRGYSFADNNRDCIVNELDVAALAEAWLLCTDPTRAGCYDAR